MKSKTKMLQLRDIEKRLIYSFLQYQIIVLASNKVVSKLNLKHFPDFKKNDMYIENNIERY